MRKINSMTIAGRGLGDRSGAILVAVLLLLLMVTILGVFSATRSSMEQRISANAKSNTTAFFAAEGGLNHAFIVAKSMLDSSINTDVTNITRRMSGDPAVWSFLLNPTGGGAAATNYYCEGCDGTTEKMVNGAWIGGGVTVVNRTFTDGKLDITYTVTAWNNDETGTVLSPCPNPTPPGYSLSGGDCSWTAAASMSTSDADGIIIIRSVAQAKVTGTATVVAEAVQQASISSAASKSGGPEGLGTSFANVGKTSTATDTNEIAAGDLAAPHSL
ncbi:MAG: hypothetical protein HZB29_06900 [Nitrospinae bacterium]|nr:hypothetical protein [Nitrospinota bacterium]